MAKSQNIYEYKRVTQLPPIIGPGIFSEEKLWNKVNELIIEQNHLMKDFELYKKAFNSM